MFYLERHEYQSKCTQIIKEIIYLSQYQWIFPFILYINFWTEFWRKGPSSMPWTRKDDLWKRDSVHNAAIHDNWYDLWSEALKPASALRVWLRAVPEIFPCAYFTMPVSFLKKVGWSKKDFSATHHCLTDTVLILFDLCSLLTISLSYFSNRNIKFLICTITGMQVPIGSKPVACSWCRATFAADFLFWFTHWIILMKKKCIYLEFYKKQCLINVYKYVPYRY